MRKKDKKKLTKRKIILSTIGAVLVIFLVLLGINIFLQPKESYSLYTLKQSPALVLQGKVNVTSQIPVQVNSEGQYQDTVVSDGQRVYQGQTVMEYSDNTKQAEILQQQNENAATQEKINNINRQLSQLRQQGNDAEAASQVTELQNSLVDANTELKNGQVKLAALQAQTAQQIKAPADGIIHVVDGEDGVPKLYVLSDQKIIKTKVSEYDQDKVHDGQLCNITSDVTNKQLSGQVLAISSLPESLDNVNNTGQRVSYYPVQIESAIKEKVGTDVHIKFPQKGIPLPQSALFTQKGKAYVYVYQHGTAKKTRIWTQTVGGSTYVKAGVKQGQKIVIDPSTKMKLRSMLIELKNINKKFALGEKNFQALREISLAIATGEYVSIMGTSGAGKTTLIDIIGFLDRDYTGSYTFNGRDVSQMTENQAAQLRNTHVGFVFQNFKLIPNLSVFENVELPLLYAGKRRGETRPIVEEALASVGLANTGAKLPNQLSGGQQQRVSIARAIINEPDFIIADEPTGALDSGTSIEIMKIFQSLHRQGKTLLIVTHDPKVGQQAQRMIRLEDGQIVMDGRESNDSPRTD